MIFFLCSFFKNKNCAFYNKINSNSLFQNLDDFLLNPSTKQKQPKKRSLPLSFTNNSDSNQTSSSNNTTTTSTTTTATTTSNKKKKRVAYTKKEDKKLIEAVKQYSKTGYR